MKRQVLFFALALTGLFSIQQASAVYNPQTGRWLSRDPAGEPGFELLQAAHSLPSVGSDAVLPHGRLFNRDPLREPGFKILTQRYEPINWDEEKNRYCFIGNDPVNLHDLFGLKCGCCKSGFWTAEVSYRVIGLMYVHGSFTGKVICSSDKSVTASVSGSADGIGIQAGLIKGKSKVGFWGGTCEELAGQTAGIFLASIGFGIGPVNIIGISGNEGSAPERLVKGDIDIDVGPSSDFSVGDVLEKPKPGFGGGGGFIGLRIKKVD